MKAKYFTAESQSAAETLAAEYFSCGEEELIFETVTGGGEESTQLLAIFGPTARTQNMDGGSGLFYEEDGVYLELYEARGSGRPLDRNALAQHISRKSVSGLDESVLRALVLKGKGRAKIASAQKEIIYGEELVIEINRDDMEAHAKLLAPEEGGDQITYEAAKEKAARAGVVHGLDEQTLETALAEKFYGREYTIARATPQQDGRDGRIVFHFNTDAKTARPKLTEEGKVDYKSLDLFEPVTEGQVLVTREPATEGTPGMTVRGKEIKQKPGKDVTLPKVKNAVVNDEKTEIQATLSGLVNFVNGTVTVSSVYKVEGDCGINVGNIEFDGSVHITGNVVRGHTIKATGDVIIGGVVEASTIIAGGNVEVKRGMQGMDRGRIEAEGSITMLYIERGTAVAGGNVVIDASIHSIIEAGASIYAKGKRGSIFGGRAIAAGDIVANSIGSISHVQTEIEVGAMPRRRARMAFLEGETERLWGEIKKLDALDVYLEKNKEKLDAETWEKLYRSGVENRIANQELLDGYAVEMSVLKEELDNATEGKVHVFDEVHPGTRITIAQGAYKVNDEITYSTFKFKDGQVVYVACEISK